LGLDAAQIKEHWRQVGPCLAAATDTESQHSGLAGMLLGPFHQEVQTEHAAVGEYIDPDAIELMFVSSAWPEEDVSLQELPGSVEDSPRGAPPLTAGPPSTGVIPTPDGLADEGEWVVMEFPGEMWKLLHGVPGEPAPGENVVLRSYAAGAKKAVIDRDTDLLTPSEMQSESAKVQEAMHKELLTWVKYECFTRHPRASARNVIDTRWVLKWKWVKVNGQKVRVIRARLTVRGFKDVQGQDLSAFAGTASRSAQRLLTSEAVLRGWDIISADVPKAFLQGISYEDLAAQTGEPLREVSFTVPPATAAELRKIPGYETFDERKEVLKCTKPGTGLRDAPKCFSLKLRQVTVDEVGFRPLALENELEVLCEDRNGVQTHTCILVKHVDDLKIAGEPAAVKKLLEALERTFGALEVEQGQFVHCGIRHIQDPISKEVSLDQMEFIAAIKEMPYPAVKGAPSEQPLDEKQASHFLSLLMTIAFAMQTRADAAVFYHSIAAGLAQIHSYGCETA